MTARFIILLVLCLFSTIRAANADVPPLSILKKGDRVCLIGNALAERMQHHGWLETYLQARHPDQQWSFRNLGFSGDTLTVRQRTSGFGTPDEHLTRCKADVIFAFFGYNESFEGPLGVESFKKQLREFITHTLAQKYNGRTAPRLVLFSPIAFAEEPDLPVDLPDWLHETERIQEYAQAMQAVASAEGVRFVDLFIATAMIFQNQPGCTINGVHLTEFGNRMLARLIEQALFPETACDDLNPELLERVRQAVLDKNLVWFNRYRATDGYNVYGGRSSLAYSEGITNFTVLQREMEIKDVMTANRDRRIWAVANGGNLEIDDSNAPPPIQVKTNKPGKLTDGRHEFPSGEEAISHMKVAEGMRVDLFADEAMFPELENPVRMAFDTRGRLWVAVWPTYPHWHPHQPMNDKLLILEDTDSDGRADVCKAFADNLHNPTGFEFWNGGVLLAQPPDLVFLKDTDGDDVADVRERLLHGLSSADTHHSANSFVIGPDGALYFQEGTFHRSQIETIYGPMRNNNGIVWRFEPRTFLVERYIPFDFANPHGHVFDRWGQNFVTDGTGNSNYFALPFSGFLPQPDKHRGYFTFFKQRSRPNASTEILSSSHFPRKNQGNLLIADVIQFKGILQYRFEDRESGFGAREVEPIVQSSHPTFRPSDLEIGPDGALYFLDWTNPLIGHMQHHLRDPSRDHEHGRVYRVTVDGRPPLKPEPIAGRSIDALLQLLKHPDDRVRYRARIELSSRDTQTVITKARAWVAASDDTDPNHEHHLLEALWLQQQHNHLDRPLLERLLKAKDFRARAAAVRVLRHMRRHVPGVLTLLKSMAGDAHPRVRLEAIVAASHFTQAEAVLAALETLRHPGDKFTSYALKETMRALEPIWKKALRDGTLPLNDHPTAVEFLLRRVSSDELLLLPATPVVHKAILKRDGIDAERRRSAAEALAKQTKTAETTLLLAIVDELDKTRPPHAGCIIYELGQLIHRFLGEQKPLERDTVVEFINKAKPGTARQLGYGLLVTLDENPEGAIARAQTTIDHLQDLVSSVRMIEDGNLRRALAETVRPLMFGTPTHLQGARRSGVRVSYYLPHPKNATIAAFDAREPQSSGVVTTFAIDIPQVTKRDAFGLRFTGTLAVPRDGDYTFYTHSDDGSRLYIDGAEVVDNDGPHGMVEKSGKARLTAGPHQITVTYYDQGGGDGLVVSWQGPGLKKQPIPNSVLSVDATRALRNAAARAMAHVPGLVEAKFTDAMLLIGAGSVVDAAVVMIDSIPRNQWPADRVRPLIDTIAAYAGGLPASQRTLPHVLAALDLGKRLARALPESEQRDVQAMLDGLGGTIILIRMVPHEMLYDVATFQVEAGKPVAVVLQNNDLMPHNFVLTRPGKLAAVGEAAERLAAESGDSELENFIPETEDILHFTRLLLPGQTQRLMFVAPRRLGDYPFVCTFPGHWKRMNGTMKVVAKVDGDPVVARTVESVDEVAMRPFVKQWKVADLADAVSTARTGRSMKRGEEMFTVAGCIKCHVFDGAGTEGGPELTAVNEKYKGVALLKQLIEPSAEIHEDYIFFTFVLDNATQVHGRIVKDDGTSLHIVENVLTPNEIKVIPKQRIEERYQSKLSAMPTGLLVSLTRDEILDLLAYLESGRN